MIYIKRYTDEDKIVWDNFITVSRIDSFLFYRDFMDYHSDRFDDCSFLIYRKNKLQAVLPGNIKDKVFYSHQGLTFGGLITSDKITTNDVLTIFDQLKIELCQIGVSEVVYKPAPIIYQIIPSQEDIYALFRLSAIKIGSNISSTIYQNNKIKFSESRKSGIRKAVKEGLTINESADFDNFWTMLNDNLQKNHDTIPVHSISEIKYLRSLFPEQIKLFTAEKDKQIIGGTVLFLMKNLIHVQYISANEAGKNLGALDFLFDKLINTIYIDTPIFDFGQSTEQMGKYLNENLIFQKEGFGGRGIVYDIYNFKIV